MASFNKVILLGNLTRDPELRYLPSNTAVCNFGMAVNHRWRDKDGNQKEEVCFVDCAAFGRQAETINQYMAKGRALLVEGRLRLETWNAQDGSKRSRHSVFVENFQFVGGRDSAEGGGTGGYSRGAPAERRSAAPTTAHEPSEPSYGADAPPPREEDIPF